MDEYGCYNTGFARSNSIIIIIHTYIPLTLYPRRGSRGISNIPPRHPRFTIISLLRNTADVTGGKPIAVLLQFISDVSAINPLVAFYDIHGGKIEVLFFYFVPDTTRIGLYIILATRPGFARVQC
jgi:hypothetical protein